MTIEELKNILKDNLKVYTEIIYSECCGHRVHTIVEFDNEIISETTEYADIVNH